MSGGSEFSSERPKGDAWGIEDAVAQAVAEFMKTGRSPLIPAVVILGIKTVKVSAGDDGPVRVPVVAIKRIDALQDPEDLRKVQKLVIKAIAERNQGKGVEMLPFDEKEVITQAFRGVDATQLEQDDRELAEDQALTDLDRLRRHMVSVHLHDQAEIDQFEVADVRSMHHADHDLGRAVMMPHDEEWWEWRRIVLAERAAELHGQGVTWGPDAESDKDQPMDDLEELRQHLIEVHDFAPDLIENETLTDMRSRHVADHDTPPEDGFPAHDLAWLGHTRDDLDAASAQAEDDETAAGAVADETPED